MSFIGPSICMMDNCYNHTHQRFVSTFWGFCNSLTTRFIYPFVHLHFFSFPVRYMIYPKLKSLVPSFWANCFHLFRGFAFQAWWGIYFTICVNVRFYYIRIAHSHMTIINQLYSRVYIFFWISTTAVGSKVTCFTRD